MLSDAGTTLLALLGDMQHMRIVQKCHDIIMMHSHAAAYSSLKTTTPVVGKYSWLAACTYLACFELASDNVSLLDRSLQHSTAGSAR